MGWAVLPYRRRVPLLFFAHASVRASVRTFGRAFAGAWAPVYAPAFARSRPDSYAAPEHTRASGRSLVTLAYRLREAGMRALGWEATFPSHLRPAFLDTIPSLAA